MASHDSLVLVIDNYDSFTYNLVDLINQFGRKTIVLRNDDPRISDVGEEADVIVLSPGPGNPEHFPELSRQLDTWVKDKAVLGICFGHQLIAHYFNGSIQLADEVCFGHTSKIETEEHWMFKGLPKHFDVMRYHALVVNKVDSPLKVIAKTSKEEVMAISHESRPIVGLQFHPESILTEVGYTLLSNFFTYVEQD